MSFDFHNIDFKQFKVRGFGKMSSENIFDDIQRANFNISCSNPVSNLLEIEDFQINGEDVAEGVVAIKQKNKNIHVLYKVPPQQADILFVPNNSSFDDLDKSPFKNKLLKMIKEDELPTELHYYSQECYLEFIFNNLLLLRKVGIRFADNVPVVFPNVWNDNDYDGVFVRNRCCTGSAFSGMDIAGEVRKYGLGATIQKMAYKFISSNMNFDLIHFSIRKFSDRYPTIYNNIWDNLDDIMNGCEDLDYVMFYLLLLFIHQNIKEGNIDLLSNAGEFYSEFEDWVLKAIELPE